MKLILDVHTHTIVSGHAYSTIRENARMAREHGLSLLAVTEHAPQMPYSCGDYYFQNLNVVPRNMEGVMLLLGSELNIMDETGAVDLDESMLEKLDITLASIHPPCYGQSRGEADNTKAYLGVMRNPYVDIIGHPDDGRYPVNYRELVEAARAYGKLLEVNNSSLRGGGHRLRARENYEKLLGLCMEQQVPIVLGTDAHVDEDVGRFAQTVELLESMDFPEELVVNTSVEKLKRHLSACRRGKKEVEFLG